MKFSIIIPVYNSAKTIKILLDSLYLNNPISKDWEVVVADDGSTDNTAQIVKIYPVKYFFQKNQGAGSARNYGAQKAKGEWLIFLDSDCEVPKNWLKKAGETIEKNHDFDVFGGGVKKPKKPSFLGWADYFSSWFNAHEGLKKQEIFSYLPSLNLLVRRETFKKLRGFWFQKMTGEDVDFCFRARQIGLRIMLVPILAVWHHTPSLKGYFKHFYNWGSHAYYLRGKNPKMAYHFLFKKNRWWSLILFLPIVFGYTCFLFTKWFKYEPIRIIYVLPLILLGRIAYAFGTLKK